MASNLLSFAGWYFLPNLVTGYVQSALYAIFIRAGEPKPAPGSPRFIRDRRNVQITVIVAYLLYTIYEADHQILQDPDFYTILGVSHNVDERAVQSRFRRLTVQFHPDKASGEDKSAVEAIYIRMKLARDVLIDPARRFAYDRFGPEILSWQSSKTIRDFVLAGLQRISGFYIGSASVLVLMGMLGYLRAGMFWRYLIMAGLFLVEVHVVTRPAYPWVLESIVNQGLLATGLRSPYLPFQMIALLRKLIVTTFIAMSQLGPLLHPPQREIVAQTGSGVAPQYLDHVDALTSAVDQELSRLTGMELNPFAGEQAAATELRTSLKEWLVQNTIRNDPEVKDAIANTLNRQLAPGANNGGRVGN